MLKPRKYLPLLLATLASFSVVKTASAEPTGDLTVVVEGLRSQKGQLCFRIFSNEKDFPLSAGGEAQSACTKITGTSVQQKFSNLKWGTYAVGILHDENQDQTLNRNFLGIPQEGFGLSNLSKISVRSGIPKFKDASFILKQNKTIRMVVIYSLVP